MMPTGEFCCEIPDDNDVNQRICITVVHLEGVYVNLSIIYPITVTTEQVFTMATLTEKLALPLTTSTTNRESEHVTHTAESTTTYTTEPATGAPTMIAPLATNVPKSGKILF